MINDNHKTINKQENYEVSQIDEQGVIKSKNKF